MSQYLCLMHFDEKLKISDFDYSLPNHRIARHPLPQRDQSKLLVYRNGEIEHQLFRDLPGLLPVHSLLVFNDTRVIHARMSFRKVTGAHIEIFCLKPLQPTEIQQAMQKQGHCRWECMVGNLKRWKQDEVLELAIRTETGTLILLAKRIGENGKTVEVEFTWNPPEMHFAQVLAAAGQIPLPPYLNRPPDASDSESYQTVYAKSEGAVAAPTAGLHFSHELMDDLIKKHVVLDKITLHVSAGTFQPVIVEYVHEHPMHVEQFVISRKNIENLLRHTVIAATGTTTLRALESLYWAAFRMVREQEVKLQFHISKNYPYQFAKDELPPMHQLMETLLDLMHKQGVDQLTGQTEIMIVPGYHFQVCDLLITNFHMPRSTLLLLIAAFTGNDWRKIYEEALRKDYRFLSYGDSSILWRK
ncbi:MAG: S-adenosylmethionine:tRNA ribosyltransferase-isomerase [Bacteroidia bacterium]